MNGAVRFHAGTLVLLGGLPAGQSHRGEGGSAKTALVAHDRESRGSLKLPGSETTAGP